MNALRNIGIMIGEYRDEFKEDWKNKFSLKMKAFIVATTIVLVPGTVWGVAYSYTPAGIMEKVCGGGFSFSLIKLSRSNLDIQAR